MKVALVLFTSCVVWFNDVSGQSSVGPDVACTDDSSCSSYSGTYCGGYSQCKKCVCPSTGYVYVESDMACLATAKIEEACTSDKQCPDKQGGTTAGGSCTSSKCECDSGYLSSSDKESCHLPYPTEDCTTNPGCNTPSVVDCTDSKCVCKSGYVVNSTTCREPTLGETCASTPGCSPTDSTCSSGTCACSTGYVKDSNSNTCRVPTLGETCASTPGCSTDFSTCSSGTCACNTGYVQDSSTCRKPYIDEACTTATGCIDTDSICLQTCSCKDTHPVANPNKMSCSQRSIGDPCTGDNVCVASDAGVTCASDVCTCPTTSAGPETDNLSCKKQVVDGTCSLDTDCVASASTCAGDPKVCACPDNYQVAADNTECRLPLYGQKCDTGGTSINCNIAMDPNLQEDCPGADANCACKAGYSQTTAGELCAKTPLDGTCTTDAANLCGSNTECSTDSKCACIQDYVAESNNIDCRKPTYGEKCTAGATTCSGDNVAQTCPDGGTCACDQYRQVSGNKCVLSTLGKDCGTAATDCDQSITNVVCTNSLCACPSTLTEADGKCREAIYNEICSGGKTCVSPYTCNTETNKCDCTTNNVYDAAISGCRNTGEMTGVSTPIDWTSTNPVYKQCDTSLTGTSALTCRQCDNNSTLTCNTAISDPQNSLSAAVHVNIFVVVLAMIMAVFYRV